MCIVLFLWMRITSALTEPTQVAPARPHLRHANARRTMAAAKRQPDPPSAVAEATEEALPGEEAALQPRPKLANSVTELIGARAGCTCSHGTCEISKV